jgi:hypothetical protein
MWIDLAGAGNNITRTMIRGGGAGRLHCSVMAISVRELPTRGSLNSLLLL